MKLRTPTSLTAVLLTASLASPAFGVVVLSDGFGDADRNNDATIDQFDWDQNEGGVLNDASQALPADQGYEPPVFPGTLIAEIGAPLNPADAADTGIRWHGAGGFTSSANADTGLRAAKIYSRIIDDTAGVLPETVAGDAIDGGLALGLNSKGRGTSIMGFFGQNVALGTTPGDQVKVSFDTRIWESSPNLNGTIAPEKADLRFGLYQDTDNQIGEVNQFGGDNFAPVVWGEGDGTLDGTLGTQPGANGDHGWAARIKMFDGYPSDGADAPTGTGSMTGPRIFEETNEDPSGVDPQRLRIMQGSDNDSVASPDDLNPNFTTIVRGNVYNLALTLERTATSILATFDVENKTTGMSFSFGGEESLTDNTDAPGTGGIQSDNWDYFALRNSSANSFGEQDYDLIIDNFLLETFEAVAGINGDYNNSGQVEQGDLDLVLQNWGVDTDTAGVPAGWTNDLPAGQIEQTELDGVLQNWGNTSAPDFSGSNVPEPATLAVLGGLGLIGLRRRSA